MQAGRPPLRPPTVQLGCRAVRPLGFGSALVPCSAATTRPDDVAVVELADPRGHPISLVHHHPAPTAPSARSFRMQQ